MTLQTSTFVNICTQNRQNRQINLLSRIRVKIGVNRFGNTDPEREHVHMVKQIKTGINRIFCHRI